MAAAKDGLPVHPPQPSPLLSEHGHCNHAIQSSGFIIHQFCCGLPAAYFLVQGSSKTKICVCAGLEFLTRSISRWPFIFETVFIFAFLDPGKEHSISCEECFRSQSMRETRCEQLADLEQFNCSALLSHISSIPTSLLLFSAGSDADDEVELGVKEASEQGVEPGEEVT